jgi:hypothetical protein
MVALGNECTLHIYDGVGHLFTPSHLNDKGVPMPDRVVQKRAYREADLFLQNHGFIRRP